MPAEGKETQGRPRDLACARPAASGLFEKTRPISHASLPEEIFRSMAAKFEPRPDKRIPSRARDLLLTGRQPAAASWISTARRARSRNVALAAFSVAAKLLAACETIQRAPSRYPN